MARRVKCATMARRVKRATVARRVKRATTAAGLLFASSFLACRGPTSASQPPTLGSRAVMPSELFPDDLDLVVRIDAARVRQNAMLAGVVRDLAKSSTSGILASAENALGEATAVWVGTRWVSDGFHGDGIVAVEVPPGGDSRAAESAEGARGSRDAAARATSARAREASGFTATVRPVPVLWPDVEVFERPAGSRSEPVLEVIVQSRGIVLATAAEADAVLRVLRTGSDPGRLDPPARGLVSFAGRLRGMVPRVTSASAFRELTDGLIGYAGSLEERGNVEVEATLMYASADRAAAAAGAAERTAKRLTAGGGAAGTMADSMKLTKVGSSLEVRASVPFAWLAELH